MQKGVEFTAYDVSKDKAKAKEMIKISGARSVPVIIVCNNIIVGFDEERLEQELRCLEHSSKLP